MRDHRISYEGLLSGSNFHGLDKPQRAYVMVFRSGIVEAAVSSLARGCDHRFLILPDIQGMILKYTMIYANALAHFGLNAPMAAFVSIIDVEGKELLQCLTDGAILEDLPSSTLTRNRLEFIECVIEYLPIDVQACARLLRPVFDHLANAAGLATSPDFDAAGSYTGG